MDFAHALDGVTRGVMVVSTIGWGVITCRVLWLSRVANVHKPSAEILLPILMSIAGILWAFSDAMAWADMQAANIRVSNLSVLTRILAGATVAVATIRFAKLSGYLTTELTTRRLVNGALERSKR